MDWTLVIIVALVIIGLFALKRASFIPAEKARQLLREGAVIVDVRTPGEFHSAHLPGALNIPLDELTNELPRRIPDKQQVILLHCLSGARSGMARQQLKKLDYLQAFNLGSYGRAEKIARDARKN